MSITSYAQNFEDVMLWRALGHIQNGRYIDIGAHDPVVDSVSLAFYEHGWRGVHVEPTPHYAELLRQARSEDIVIQAAVGAKSGMLCIYEFPNTGLSTVDRQIAEMHISNGFPAKEIVVPSITLDDVFSSGTGEEIHWLKIDVEGGEKQVLEGWVDTALRPWIVLIESTYPNTQIETHEPWESLVLSKGYTFAYFDGLSRFYIADGHDELFKAFSSGPNIFDVMSCGFSLSATTPFCSTLNRQIFSLKEQRERERLEAEQRLSLRENELTDQVCACKAEVAQVTQSSANEQKELSIRLHAIQLDILETLKNAAARERTLTQQLQENQQELRSLDQAWAQREKEHAEQINRDRQELIDLLRRQAQREQEVAAELLTIQQQAAHEKAELVRSHSEQERELHRQIIEREHDLTQQLLAIQQQAAQEKAELARSHSEQTHILQREHAEHEQALIQAGQQELWHLEQARTDMQHRFEAQLLAEHEASQHLQQKLNTLQHELSTMRNSLSWRLTAPLRAVVAGWVMPSPTQSGITVNAVEDPAVAPTSHHEPDTASQSTQEFADNRLFKETTTMISDHKTEKTQPRPSGAVPNLKTLLQHQDRRFVECAYQTLLKRQPDPEGLNYYLGWLHAGMPRVQVLGQIMDSREAQMLGVEIPGLRKVIRLQKMISLPLAGKVLQIFIGAGMLDAVSPLNELLKRHNGEFIEHAYLTLLKRAPDPEGFDYYLDRLRSGVPKIQLLGQLLDSGEAHARGVEFLGLRRAVRHQKIARLPLVGTLLKRFIAVEGNSAVETRLRAIEQQIFLLAPMQQSLAAIAPAATKIEPADGLIQSEAPGDFSVVGRADLVCNAIPPTTPAKIAGASENYIQTCWQRYHTLRLDSEKPRNQPLLSLCITTYNRAQWLKHSLDNILPQLKGIEHLVEFVICDNASIDDTEAVVKEYAGRNSCLKYFRNAQNVGMLGNLGVTARHALGKFVWIIGDDDILLEGTLENILRSIIAFPDIELIYTNYSYTHVSDPLSVNLQELLATQTLISPVSPDRYTRCLREVAGNTENFFTAIYCCIFRQDHAIACFSQDTSGSPFSSLLTCVPTTNYVLNNLLSRPGFWSGKPAVMVNMNVSWLKYADLWVLERFPEMYEAFEKKGVSSAQVDFYRTRSIHGVVHHLRDSVTRKSENLGNINLKCLFRSYKHLDDFKKSLPELFSIIDSDPKFKSHVAFETLQSAKALPVTIDGPFVGSYSLAIVNRRITTALQSLGQDVSIGPSPTEGSPFVIEPSSVNPIIWDLYKHHGELQNQKHIALRYTYPPLTNGMKGQLNLYHSFGWEESEFPSEFVDWFNKNLDAVTVMSNYVKRVLEHNGVEIPVINTGLGVDHLCQFTDSQYCCTNNERFTFLHISSCFPRKGVDILLEAFLKCFNGTDSVRLIIKTFPNPHNDVEHQLALLRELHQSPPEVIIINEDWSDQNQLVELYNKCDVLVAPSRGEGFGLPIAEALWLGKPVIATGFGGQIDFLGEDYPWLIDYRFERSNTHLGVVDSYWASPCVDDLVRLLRNAYCTSSDERQKIAGMWKDRLEKNFTWRQTGIRLLNAIDQIECLTSHCHEDEGIPGAIAVVSTWNSRCGIATYTKNLLIEFPSNNYKIYANAITTQERTLDDEFNVMRNWQVGDISGLIAQLEKQPAKTLIIQYQPGFFGFDQLTQLVGKAIHQGSFVYLFLHNVLDFANKCPESDSPIFCSGNVRIMVHTISDMNLIKSSVPWVLPNAVHFSHGVIDAHDLVSTVDKRKDDQFIIATFGFLLPTKGVAELIKAVSIALDEVPRLQLKLYTSLLDDRSHQILKHCLSLIDATGIRDRVEWRTEFLPIDDAIKMLSQADLIVMPYGSTTESASGAARVAISSGTPLLCTREHIFDDIAPVVRFVDSNDPGAIASEIVGIVRNRDQLDEQIERQSKWVKIYSWQQVSKKLRSMVKGQGFQFLA